MFFSFNFWFCCDKFNISMFSHIVQSFSKNDIIYQLKKFFFRIIFRFFSRSVFISIYGFSHAFWLNLITWWTLFKTNAWVNACTEFAMCITYSVLSCKLARSFSTFTTVILSGENGNSLWSLYTFSRYRTSISRKYLSSLCSL